MNMTSLVVILMAVVALVALWRATKDFLAGVFWMGIFVSIVIYGFGVNPLHYAQSATGKLGSVMNEITSYGRTAQKELSNLVSGITGK